MKLALTIGFLLMFLNSAFPPRLSPKWPESNVSRAFILSKYFYFSHYSRTPIGDPSQESYKIDSEPAALDWARYVAETLMIASATGIGCLFANQKKGSAVRVESGES